MDAWERAGGWGWGRCQPHVSFDGWHFTSAPTRRGGGPPPCPARAAWRRPRGPHPMQCVRTQRDLSESRSPGSVLDWLGLHPLPQAEEGVRADRTASLRAAVSPPVCPPLPSHFRCPFSSCHGFGVCEKPFTSGRQETHPPAGTNISSSSSALTACIVVDGEPPRLQAERGRAIAVAWRVDSTHSHRRNGCQGTRAVGSPGAARDTISRV